MSEMKPRTLEDVLRDSTRRPLPWLAGVLLILFIHLSPYWVPSPDSASYVSMARSLATHGVAMDLGRPAYVYVIGYPLLVSPCFLTSDQPFLLLSLFQVVAAILLGLGVHRWLVDYCPVASLLVAALVVVNVSMWEQATHFQSDLVFTTILVWTGVVFRRILFARRISYSDIVLGTCLLALLCVIRYIGLTIGMGLGVGFFWRACRGKCSWSRALAIPAAIGAPGFAAAMMLLIHNKALANQVSPGTGTYADWFVNFLSFDAAHFEGIRLRISEIGRILLPGMYKAYAKPGVWFDINMLIYIPLALAVCWGCFATVRRRLDPLMLTAPIYGVVYLIWPIEQGTRYFFPIAAVLWVGVWYWIKHLRRHRLSILFFLTAGHLVVMLVYAIPARIHAGRYEAMREPSRRFLEAIPTVQRSGTALVGFEDSREYVVRQEFDLSLMAVDRPTDVPGESMWAVSPGKIDMKSEGFKSVRQTADMTLWQRAK